jgi:hypothetical protein
MGSRQLPETLRSAARGRKQKGGTRLAMFTPVPKNQLLEIETPADGAAEQKKINVE